MLATAYVIYPVDRIIHLNNRAQMLFMNGNFRLKTFQVNKLVPHTLNLPK